MSYIDQLQKAVDAIRKVTNFKPEAGIVLGSGLSGFSEDIRVLGKIPYSKIPGFPVSTVEGHNGQFIFGYVENIPVILMDGRVHYYEGYSMQEVVMPVRIMGMLGAKYVLLSNASGGINKSFYEGTLMLINDQISSFVPSPLIGPDEQSLGVRFPDMSEIYDKQLREIVTKTARSNAIAIREGVYLQVSGPNYESPAEIKMFQTLGADAVGMSTACEAIALRHMGIKVVGISCITNMASGISKKQLSHDDVKHTAAIIGNKFRQLVWNSIINIHNELFPKKKPVVETEQKPKVDKKVMFDDDFSDFEIINIK